MKTRVYLRIAKLKGRRVKVIANTTPSHESISTGPSYAPNYHPTVLVALDLEIPDKEFDDARILLEAKIKETTPAVNIKQVQTDNETA